MLFRFSLSFRAKSNFNNSILLADLLALLYPFEKAFRLPFLVCRGDTYKDVKVSHPGMIPVDTPFFKALKCQNFLPSKRDNFFLGMELFFNSKGLSREMKRKERMQVITMQKTFGMDTMS